MSIRAFIFCDICNPDGIRTLELRRSLARQIEGTGRRISDGRSWFAGSRDEARAAGWHFDTDTDQDICPRCLARHQRSD